MIGACVFFYFCLLLFSPECPLLRTNCVVLSVLLYSSIVFEVVGVGVGEGYIGGFCCCIIFY